MRPSEFVLGLRRAGLKAAELRGLSYELGTGNWRESRDLSVNYMIVATRG